MEQKMKIIAGLLAVCCFASLFFAATYFNKYSTLDKEYNQLKRQNDTLVSQNNALSQKEQDAREEIDRQKAKEEALQRDLDRANAQYEEVQRKNDMLEEEKKSIQEKLDKLAEEKASAAVAPAQPVIPQYAEGTAGGEQYWADILKQKADLELKVNSLKDTIRDNQLKMDELAKDKTNLDFEAQKLNKEKTDVQRQLEYNEKMVDSLTLQLVREKDDKRKIEKQSALLKEENYALRSRLKEVMNNKVSVSKKLKETEDKRLELYNRINQMDQLLQDKLSEVIDVKHDISDIRKGSNPVSRDAVELSPIVVRSAASQEEPVKETSLNQAAIAEPALDGARVLGINTENNFVIIDKGENQGITKGQNFRVYRNGLAIAAVEVIQLRPNISAADIKEKSQDIKVGDVVK